uniref:Exonuclease domain-containing protein n=1 Tax=Glossina austeni TaxID=7395 RepID=A0A1A9UKZ7_GLOAU
MPLVVDYRLKNAASGRMNFMRRQLGPSEKEISSARLIDRSIRPLFPLDYRTETHHEAASAALSLSDIPWNGLIGAVRLGLCDGEIVINPTRRELKNSQLDLVVSATEQNLVVMLDDKGNVVLQQDLLKAIKQGTHEVYHIVQELDRLQRTFGKEKRPREPSQTNQMPADVIEAVRSMGEMRLPQTDNNNSSSKTSKSKLLQQTYDYVICVDFEATCWENQAPSRWREFEIIEFPAVLVNLKTGKIEVEFRKYIMPIESPKLNAFCTKLTGSAQKTVDNSIPLQTALMMFQEWLRKELRARHLSLPKMTKHNKLCLC